MCIGRTSTLDALHRRGLIAGDRRWTELGRCVAARAGARVHALDELHEMALAEDARLFPVGSEVVAAAKTLTESMIAHLRSGEDGEGSAPIYGNSNVLAALVGRGLINAGMMHYWTPLGRAVMRHLLGAGRVRTLDELHETALAEYARREAIAPQAIVRTPDAGVGVILVGGSERVSVAVHDQLARIYRVADLRPFTPDTPVPHTPRAVQSLRSRAVGRSNLTDFADRAIEQQDWPRAGVFLAAHRAEVLRRRMAGDLVPLPERQRIVFNDRRFEVGDIVRRTTPGNDGTHWRVVRLYEPGDGREPFAGLEAVTNRPKCGTRGTGLRLGILEHVKPSPAAPTARDALLRLRDEHLPSLLRTCVENDEAMARRDRITDPEWYPLHAADVRTMIADVARELGVELPDAG